MIDVHCHLNFKSFGNDVDEVIKRAFDAGVIKIINVGTQVSSSQKAVELAKQYDNLYAIIGVHPHHADKLENNWIQELQTQACEKKVVAIGEIGMDFFDYKSNGIVEPKIQQEVFEKQIELAHQVYLPIQIHNRHAGKEILEILNHHKSLLMDPPGMFHCFAGSMEILKKVLDLGFCAGFDGNITYKGLAPGETTTLSELAKYTPIDRIVIETDSPYLTPEPHRGRRNEPKYAILIGEFLAKLKDISFEKLQEQTTKNAETVFRL